LKSAAVITMMDGEIEAWIVEFDGQKHLALSAEQALDAVMYLSEGNSVSVKWENVAQDFEPPGWSGRLPRLPPNAMA
jgi:hypothetical protein